MQIKRNYSQPFFSSRRRRRVGGRFLFFYGLLIGGFLVFVFTQFTRLQLVALDAVGLAPTPTPFAATWATEGYDLYLQGRLTEAADAFRQAVTQQPDNINYVYEYGRILIELDRSFNAAYGYDQIINLLKLSEATQKTLSGRNIKDAELASLLGEHALQIASDDVRSYTLRSRALYWLDDSETAIPVALQGLELDSAYAPLLAVLALSYTDIGRYQQGLKYGEEAVAADTLSIEAHRAYAIALILVGERDAAIKELEDAININPNLTAPYFELAGQFLGAQQYEDAVATYETILKLDPRSPKALLRLCETYAQIGQDEQAEGYCDDSIASDPTYAKAYRQLGVVNYHRRNYEGAIENFNKCIDLGSDEIQCYYLRGLAHYYIGDCSEAWTILNETLGRVDNSVIDNPVLISIQSGLTLITENCNAYQNAVLPTLIPPTPIPPTPIGTGG